jgi:hypothetical protein
MRPHIHRRSMRARRWKVPKIDNDVPRLIVVESPIRSGHSRRRDSVLNDPSELAIAIALNIGRCERWNRRGSARGKRNTRILAVAAMAYHAIVAEDPFAGFYVLGRYVHGILLTLSADSYMMLGPLQHRGFGPPRLPNLASRKVQAGNTAQQKTNVPKMRHVISCPSRAP